MKVIIVEDEELAIKQFEMECAKLPWVNIEERFTDAESALEYIKENRVEVVFLDIMLPGMNGIELGKEIRKLKRGIVIVFLTAYDDYALTAIKIKADYYLMKPYSSTDFRAIMENARLLTGRQKKRIQIRTFGRFEISIDGEILNFPNAKSKELLALCVDHRGGNVMMEEAIDKLWENRAYDKKVKNLYRKAIMNLRGKMAEYGAEDLLITERGSCHLNCDDVDCDWFKLMEDLEEMTIKERTNYLSKIRENYMSEYSWAEETNAKYFGGVNGTDRKFGMKILLLVEFKKEYRNIMIDRLETAGFLHQLKYLWNL